MSSRPLWTKTINVCLKKQKTKLTKIEILQVIGKYLQNTKASVNKNKKPVQIQIAPTDQTSPTVKAATLIASNSELEVRDREVIVEPRPMDKMDKK